MLATDRIVWLDFFTGSKIKLCLPSFLWEVGYDRVDSRSCQGGTCYLRTCAVNNQDVGAGEIEVDDAGGMQVGQAGSHISHQLSTLLFPLILSSPPKFGSQAAIGTKLCDYHGTGLHRTRL